MTEDLVLRESDRLTIFRDTEEGVFLDRPNRFVVDCLVNGRKTRAHLPNPGRLWERSGFLGFSDRSADLRGEGLCYNGRSHGEKE